MDLLKSSSGGYIEMTKTGLVHRAADQAYSGRLAEEGTEAKVYDAPKRGRGRPKKVSQTGAVYDWTPFGRVKVPLWTGSRTVYTRKESE